MTWCKLTFVNWFWISLISNAQTNKVTESLTYAKTSLLPFSRRPLNKIVFFFLTVDVNKVWLLGNVSQVFVLFVCVFAFLVVYKWAPRVVLQLTQFWNHLTRWLDKKICDAFSISQKRHQIYADPLRPIAIPRFAPGMFILCTTPALISS